ETEAQPKNPERLELEELTGLQPGLARLMPEIGARFWKAHYAARAQNWPLASWQLREMRKLMRLGTVTRPKYTDDLEEFIHEGGVRDARVLAAMAAVPRELFVPATERDLAYADRALPIGHGQTISQPLMVAVIVEALELSEGETALDVGTGSGYQAAVMAAL